MNGTRKWLGIALALALCLTLGSSSLRAQAPAAGQDTTKAPKYTLVEFNAEQACANESNPVAKIRCLDDFVSKYPNSELLNFVYPLYTQAYGTQKNYAKVIEYADKLSAMSPDKAQPGERFNGFYTHCAAYNALLIDPGQRVAAADPAIAKAAQTAALGGLEILPQVKKGEGVTDDAWAKQVTGFKVFLNGVAAQGAMVAKDCSSAAKSYKAVLELNPDDAVSTYQLGRAYSCMTPPQPMDAFWYYAKAVTSKGATQKQAEQIKKFLKSSVVNYQGGNVCDSLTDGELNELLQLAGSSADRPGSYTLPSAADISAVQKDMTIASVFSDLKAGGDKSKLTWLAACGLEFPEVPGKLIEVVPGDPIVLKIAFVTSDAEFDAATTPNMDVKVVGQPEAARVEKNNPVHFTGTLVSYDPDPAFFLHWDKAKVKAEDIPKEKTPKKPPVRRPTKRPSGQ